MRLDSWMGLALAASLALFTAGCPDDEQGSSSTTSSGPGGGGEGGTIVPDAPPLSAKATVKFKSKERLLADFQKALFLDDQVCTEVGTYGCDEVHGIALGGVDAYNAGIYEPLAASAVTTPIAVDRIALKMCQTRAHEDFEDLASAKIFELAVSSGALDPEDAGSVAAITTLFNRIHLREPTDRELALMQQLYRDIEAGGSATPAKDWAALSCYAVISMMESVFY